MAAESLADFERLAKEKLSQDENLAGVWDFIDIVGGDGQTYEDSKLAFRRYRFQPRILTARADRSLSTTVLGQPIRIPIGIAPALGYSPLHPDGDATAGRAAAKAQTLMILTSAGDQPIEEFVEKVPASGLYWAQLYPFKDRRNSQHIIKNAEKGGFKALVVTVDTPVPQKVLGSGVERMGPGYGDIRLKTPAANIRFLDGKERDFSKEQALGDIWNGGPGLTETFCCPSWEELRWVKSQTKLPIIFKGVVTAEAARQAAAFGVSGIIVSAHGGRMLDGIPAPIDALPEVVDAVKGTDIEVYMDGGIRTGNDVLKALALGARAVFIGKPALCGLAVNGEEGIYEVLKILENELSTSMALCGCSTIEEIDRSIVKHESEFNRR